MKWDKCFGRKMPQELVGLGGASTAAEGEAGSWLGKAFWERKLLLIDEA